MNRSRLERKKAHVELGALEAEKDECREALRRFRCPGLRGGPGNAK
ncbi:MAG TPA: hypothetical protein VGG72_15070 [Bryobacteraceae bacterium]|jgi:hypothetical protein